jgi:Ca-activated chloride channel family protein
MNIQKLGQDQLKKIKTLSKALGLVALAVVIYGFAAGALHVLTPDQKGFRLFGKQRYDEAAKNFSDPLWQGTAYFRAGDFKAAAGVFAGYDTAETAFNHGTSLVMLGKYEEAILRYERALELKLGWAEAETNLAIARSRAAALKKEGGNMTGGKLGADEIVFEKGKSSPEAETEEVAGGEEMSDADMRAIWLRTVQTRPADFLKVKFAYQYAATDTGESAPEPSETRD